MSGMLKLPEPKKQTLKLVDPKQIHSRVEEIAPDPKGEEKVRVIYEVSLKAVDLERATYDKIETKATTLLSGVAITMTLTFSMASNVVSVGGAEHPWLKNILMVLIVLAVMAGTTSSIMALLALVVKTIAAGVSGALVFDQQLFVDSDADAHRRALISHLWGIANSYREVSRNKAKLTKNAQISFGVFIGLSSLAGCLLLLAKCLGW